MRYGETEPVGLTIAVVGILSEDHHLYLVKRCMVECIEYQFPWRIYRVAFLLLHQERFEFNEIGRLELFPEHLFPSLFDIRMNGCHGTERYQKYGNPATYGR